MAYSGRLEGRWASRAGWLFLYLQFGRLMCACIALTAFRADLSGGIRSLYFLALGRSYWMVAC